MINKKIYVTQPSLPEYKDYCDEIKNIWESNYLTNNGPKHQLLENSLKDYLEACNITLFTNGHLALTLGIKAYELSGEVITTPFTFTSTINAIVENGLTPVFCDIKADDYTIDPNEIEKHISKNTCAILPVHVYGNICDVDAIESIASKYDLKVIYDAAHVFGTKYRNKAISTYGDACMYSFHATKVFNTIEGGALVYKNNKLKEKLDALKNFGLNKENNVEIESINAKMNEFQAAMGLCNLKNIENEIEKRKIVYKRYYDNLKGVKGIKLNSIQPYVKSNYAYFPILVKPFEYGLDRDELYEYMNDYDINCRKYFYPLITDLKYYRNKYDSNKTPIAKYIASNILCLPMYANLSVDEIDYICSVLIKGGK